jgi:sugar/nucleoside kinase (ribokinase family)
MGHTDAPREFDVLVVGDLNADLILSGDVTPSFAQVEKLLDDVNLTIGSSAAIFACGAARLGLRTAFVGKVGDDTFGRFMVDSLRERGIDMSGVVVDATIKTGLSVILSRRTDRAILTYLGSIAALRFPEIDLDLLKSARHLHLGSFFLLDALRPDIPQLFETARSLGCSVSLDTNYDPAEKWNGNLLDALKQVDIFLPNETELLCITRETDVRVGLQSLGEVVPLIALKRGADGAVARQGAETYSAHSIPVKVVDTTGAGDSFDAGFIYGYLNGWDVPRSLQLACICGALSTQASGGTSAQPTLSGALSKMVS